VTDAFGHYLAGASLADGTDAELSEIGETLALGMLGSSQPASSLPGIVSRARRILFDAELDTPEFSACLARLEALSHRAAERLAAMAKLTAEQVERRLRDGVMRDAAYAAWLHG
jgi:hypothetical protein